MQELGTFLGPQTALKDTVILISDQSSTERVFKLIITDCGILQKCRKCCLLINLLRHLLHPPLLSLHHQPGPLHHPPLPANGKVQGLTEVVIFTVARRARPLENIPLNTLFAATSMNVPANR